MAEQERQTLVVTVEGPEDQLAAFVELCETIGYLCAVGSSRAVQVSVDGDGAGSLSFDYGETDVSEIAPVDTEDDPIRVAGIGV